MCSSSLPDDESRLQLQKRLSFYSFIIDYILVCSSLKQNIPCGANNRLNVQETPFFLCKRKVCSEVNSELEHVKLSNS
jgi:hypothetical protein